jgi:hypothetical protein
LRMEVNMFTTVPNLRIFSLDKHFLALSYNYSFPSCVHLFTFHNRTPRYALIVASLGKRML